VFIRIDRYTDRVLEQRERQGDGVERDPDDGRDRVRGDLVRPHDV